MTSKRGILETVVAEFDSETADTEISIPDETDKESQSEDDKVLNEDSDIAGKHVAEPVTMPSPTRPETGSVTDYIVQSIPKLNLDLNSDTSDGMKIEQDNLTVEMNIEDKSAGTPNEETDAKEPDNLDIGLSTIGSEEEIAANESLERQEETNEPISGTNKVQEGEEEIATYRGQTTYVRQEDTKELTNHTNKEQDSQEENATSKNQISSVRRKETKELISHTSKVQETEEEIATIESQTSHVRQEDTNESNNDTNKVQDSEEGIATNVSQPSNVRQEETKELDNHTNKVQDKEEGIATHKSQISNVRQEETKESVSDRNKVQDATKEVLRNGVNVSNEVLELTRENLEQHARLIKAERSSKTFQAQIENGNKDTTTNSNVTDQKNVRNVNKKSISGTSGKINIEQKNNETLTEILDKQLNDAALEKSAKSVSKSTNGSFAKFSDKIARSSSKISIRDTVEDTKQKQTDLFNVKDISSPESSHHKSRESDMESKKSNHSNVKRKGKKKKRISLDNVETLVSQNEYSHFENKVVHKNKVKSKENKNVQEPKLLNEDSGIEKDLEENVDVEHTGENFDDHTVNKNGHFDEVPKTHVPKRLLRRTRIRRIPKRPMYDAMNTSTTMILLNNKYGKHSRLWRSEENDTDRSKLINPLRHLKEPSFYVSGNFHSRCSTSESNDRHCFHATNNLKFDFSDRPHSDKIGDRLYEARMSVNPRRHRSCCQCKLPNIPKPLDFTAPTKQERSNTYVFAWERLYAEPMTRPTTSMRPISSLSGKQIGTQTVRIPHAMPTSPDKNTI